MSRVVVFDLDGTLLQSNSSFSFALYLFSKGEISYPAFAYLSYRFFLFRFLNTSYKQLQTAVFKRIFQGKSLKTFTDYIPSFIEQKISTLFYGPAILKLKNHLRLGHRVMILSNSPNFLVEPIGASLNVFDAHGSRYTIDQGGRLVDIAFLLDGHRKTEIVKGVISQTGSSVIYAYSDSCQDLPLLELADYPTVVRPDLKLKRIALNRGWEIL
ncbi:MAG: HAD-IB family phosphatase [Chlamydiia bacterium]|nr:HAD-IB family phosphatase [Chlamydiia bacterium]